jgi:hypothetical protein
MLMFEWVLMGYYVYLFGSIINSGVQYQLRIIIYCIIFLLFEKLELTYKYLEFEDPLHLMPLTKCIRYVIFVCVGNIMLLMIRIVIENHNIHAFIIFMHFLLTIVFFINEISKKNTKLDMNIDQSSVFSKIITPILLFIFNKTSESTLSEFWFIEFLVFATNLFVSVELERILLLKECQYFGWMSFEESGKSKSNWHKRRALRTIIVICCILIVTQNLLLIFDKIKYEISVTIWHTFMIAILSYLLYGGYFPFKQ